MTRKITGTNVRNIILAIVPIPKIWWFVVRGSWFVVVVFYVPTVLYCSTDFLYMCSKKKHKADHGHKKGHAPRAQDGHSSTGISRPRTEVLRTRAYFSAADTLLRSRASREHLNLYYVVSFRFDFASFRLPRSTKNEERFQESHMQPKSEMGWRRRRGVEGIIMSYKAYAVLRLNCQMRATGPYTEHSVLHQFHTAPPSYRKSAATFYIDEAI